MLKAVGFGRIVVFSCHLLTSTGATNLLSRVNPTPLNLTTKTFIGTLYSLHEHRELKANRMHLVVERLYDNVTCCLPLSWSGMPKLEGNF